MNKNSALAPFCRRFQEVLDAMDEFEADENLDEINAQFEDVLFLMESIDEDDEDAWEEIIGAFEELKDLLQQYQSVAKERNELMQKVTEFEMAIEMAERNLM